MICDGVPSFLGLGVGGCSYSNLLAFTEMYHNSV